MVCTSLFVTDASPSPSRRNRSTLERNSSERNIIITPRPKQRLFNAVTNENSESLGNSFLESDYTEMISVNESRLKDDVRDTLVNWVAKDMRSFNIASSKQFLKVAQNYIDIGAKHGRVDAASITPSDRTISRRVNQIYNDLLGKVMPEVIEAISDGKRRF